MIKGLNRFSEKSLPLLMIMKQFLIIIALITDFIVLEKQSLR